MLCFTHTLSAEGSPEILRGWKSWVGLTYPAPLLVEKKSIGPVASDDTIRWAQSIENVVEDDRESVFQVRINGPLACEEMAVLTSQGAPDPLQGHPI